MDLITPGFGLLFWNTITFLTVFLLLAKLAWKPILGALNEREETITTALEAAEQAKRDIANMQSQNEQLLAEARNERDKLLKDAVAASSRLVEEAKERASAEGNRLIESARAAINSEKTAALNEVRAVATELSIGIAEKIIRKELSSDAAQKDLVQKYMDEVKAN